MKFSGIERTNLAILVVSIGLVWLAIAWPVFTGKVYAETDFARYHIPMRHFYAEALDNGTDPHWYPYTYAGFHLHGEGQSALYHPLTWLTARWLPVEVGLVGDVLRNYVLPVVGGFLLLSRIGLRRDAALLGAALFAFGAYNTMRFMHINAVAIVGHLPFSLLALDVLLRSARPAHVAWATWALSLLTASKLLLSHPQFVWLCGLVEASFVLFLLVSGVGRRRWFWIPAAMLLGVVIASVQVLPQWESLQLSFRRAPQATFINEYALHPVNLVQLVSPYFYSTRAMGLPPIVESALYAGSLLPVLLMWVAVRWRALRGWRGALVASLLLAATGVLLALGDSGGVHALLTRLPVVGLFRAPARYLLLTQAGLALIAAISFADLARVAGSRIALSRARLAWLFLPAGLATALALASLGPLPPLIRYFVADGLGIVSGALLLTGFAALAALASRGRRMALVLLAALAITDLGVYGVTWMNRRGTSTLEALLDRHPPPQMGAGHRAHRGPTALTMRNVRFVIGYAGIIPERRLPIFVDLARADDTPLSPAEIAAFRVAGVGWAHGEAVPDPLPRLRLVGESVAEAPRLFMQLGAIDVATTAVTPGAMDLGGDRPGRLAIVREASHHIELSSDAPSVQLLVFAEGYHPGWKAWVDGEPAPIVQTYGDFMGIVVPKGEHGVELLFSPDSVRTGRVLTVIGLALSVALSLSALRTTSEAPD